MPSRSSTAARGAAFTGTGGWNLRAVASWGLGAGVGLLAVSLPNYQGPLLSWTGGVDCSFLLSGVVGGLAYLALTARSRTAERAAPDMESETALVES